MSSNSSQTILCLCGAVRDATGVDHRPGAIALRDGRIEAVGDVKSVEQAIGEHQTVEFPGVLIMPAMVNVHAHLDLHAIGRVPLTDGFIEWVANHVMPWRASATPSQIDQSVVCGLLESREAGVGAIGDIAASPAAVSARMDVDSETLLPGMCWVEGLGFGDATRESSQRIRTVQSMYEGSGVGQSKCGIRVDIQPHAPYSAEPSLYEWPWSCGSTHLAETPEEAKFVMDASGPITDFRKQIGRWNEAIQGFGVSPVAHFCNVAKPIPWVVAHCNYVSDEDIAMLAAFEGDITVAYCPIASEYFRHTDHRYREMIEAGINVALGTDSILCQPEYELQPMGILPQMRRLWQRDRTDVSTLLRMATINGAKAMSPSGDRWGATLSPGEPARLIGVKFDVNDETDPLIQVLENHEPVEPFCFHL